jgi:hypothetical protein
MGISGLLEYRLDPAGEEVFSVLYADDYSTRYTYWISSNNALAKRELR